MMGNPELQDANAYAVLAEFADPEHLLEAVRRTKAAGYRDVDAFSPFPIEGLGEALGAAGSGVARLALAGGILGAAAGLLLQWYGNAVSYPINVGGRPLEAWPAFVIPAFETAVLFAVLAAVFGMLIQNRLPRLNHPIFAARRFTLATDDRFFLAIHGTDPRFDPARCRRFLASLDPAPVAVDEVPA